MTSQALTYTSYLAVDELLQLQRPQSKLKGQEEHDELLFIIIHQTYELWFKQILHEFKAAALALEAGDSHYALAILRRIRTILKICVSQVDVLETMTPLQFQSFRQHLDSSSGFQSVQFREVEAILGRRDAKMDSHFPEELKAELNRLRAQRSLWDSMLVYVASRGFEIPTRYLERDFRDQYQPHLEVEDALLAMARKDPEGSLVCEALLDIDEGLQEWRYRHVKMVERTIGRKAGTGGSSGADYLASTLFRPVFPDLWAIRSRL